jgi:hypothetical protein
MKIILNTFADGEIAKHLLETYDFLTGESAGWIVGTR